MFKIGDYVFDSKNNGRKKNVERPPQSIAQEDDKLLMYYDFSLGRV